MDSRIETFAQCIVERATAVIDSYEETSYGELEPVHLAYYRLIRSYAKSILREIDDYRNANPELYEVQK